MHVGFFTDSYVPRQSGVVRAVESMARHLRAKGHLVSIVAPAYPGFTDTDPDVYRVPSVVPPGYADFPLAVPYSSAPIRAVRDLGLDVVHTHSPFLLGGVALWMGRALRRPVVFTYHTLYSEYSHYAPLVGEWTRPLVIAYTTAYCNRCDRVLASVPSVAAMLRDQGVKARIDVIPSVGIEPDEFAGGSAEGIRESFGLPPAARLLVFVGRLAREKGISLLLRALAQLPTDTWLLVLGDGPERLALSVLARRLGVAERTIFGGPCDHGVVVRALFAADLFVFPSQTETLGLVLLEAMAAGRAIVAVRAAASADIVRDGKRAS